MGKTKHSPNTGERNINIETNLDLNIDCCCVFYEGKRIDKCICPVHDLPKETKPSQQKCPICHTKGYANTLNCNICLGMSKPPSSAEECKICGKDHKTFKKRIPKSFIKTAQSVQDLSKDIPRSGLAQVPNDCPHLSCQCIICGEIVRGERMDEGKGG